MLEAQATLWVSMLEAKLKGCFGDAPGSLLGTFWSVEEATGADTAKSMKLQHLSCENLVLRCSRACFEHAEAFFEHVLSMLKNVLSMLKHVLSMLQAKASLG